MKTNNNIQDKIDSAFDALNTIEKVSVSTDFSSKVFDKLASEHIEVEKNTTWFTPQLQFAAMIVVLLINASVIYYAFNTSEITENTSEIEQFAKEYHINSETTISLN
jgi:hypothetical protein